jgi:heat shock protein HslJ
MTLTTIIRARGLTGPVGAAAVMALLLVSCEDGVTNPSDLGGEWRLEALRAADGTEFTPPDPGRFTVEFEADGQVLARADCNGCGGRYVLGDDTLVISQMACTEIACPGAPFDQRYLEVLVGESSFDLDDGTLEVRSSRGTLRFRR